MEELFNQFGWRITLEKASLPDGREKKAILVHRADSVHIMAFTQERLMLVLREYRPFYQKYVWMLPSGRADKENDVETAAQRELQEETGYRAKKLTHYGSTRHSETLQCNNHIFIAEDLVRDPLQQDEDELIEVHEMPFNEAIAKILGSDPVHTASAYAVLRYAREHP